MQIKPKPKKQLLTVDMLSAAEYNKYRREGKKAYLFTLKSILCMFLVIASVGILIYMQTVQTTLNSEEVKLSSQLNLLTSENVRLQVKIESELSNDAIEQIARDIGMEELNNSNIEYISFNPEAKAQVMEQGNIFDRVVDWCEVAIMKFQVG